MTKDSPEVVELRKRIEVFASRKIKTPIDFEYLKEFIWINLHETISTSTIKRLWGYVDGGDRTRVSTLNLLSRLLRYKDWEDFTEHLKEEQNEESCLCIFEVIRSSELEVGEEIEVGWQPNRRCVFKYLGDNQYEVIEIENSKLQVGDLFHCSIFFKHEPMYVDNIIRPRTKPISYIAGSKGGLTVLKRHTKEK